MKSRWLMLFGIGWMSCATPRYAYDFGQPASVISSPTVYAVPLTPPPPSDAEPIMIELREINQASGVMLESAKAPVATQIDKRAAPSRRLNPGPPPRSGPVTGDLKRSVIFVGAGLIALLIGGSVLIVLGSLSLLIGIIFSIKWLLRE